MKFKQIIIRPKQYVIGRENPITEIEIDFDLGGKITNFRTRDQKIIKDVKMLSDKLMSKYKDQ